MKQSIAVLLVLVVAVPSNALTPKTVCASGCDYTSATIQAAVNAIGTRSAHHLFEYKTGETFGALNLPAQTTNGYWVEFRSSTCSQLPAGTRVPASNANMATLSPSGSTIIITADAAASKYRFRCLEITNQAATDPYALIQFLVNYNGSDGNVRLDQLPNDIEFDRVWIHSTVETRNNLTNAIVANTGRLKIVDSRIEAFNNNTEAHAFAAWNAAGPHYFRNNLFQGSQIATIHGGTQPSVLGQWATGLTFLGNYFYRPWWWWVTSGTSNPSGTCRWDANGGQWFNQTVSVRKWQCVSGTWTDMGAGTAPVPTTTTTGQMQDKNQFELKSAWGTYFAGNVIENGWGPGMQSQHGAAVLFNQVDTYNPLATVKYVDFEYNLAKNTPWGLSIGKVALDPSVGSDYRFLMSDLRFRHNLWLNIGAFPESENTGLVGGSLGWQFHSAIRHSMEHNTLILNQTSVQGAGATLEYILTDASVVGNVIPFSYYGWYEGNFGNANNNSAINFAFPNARNFGRNVMVNEQSKTNGGNPSNQVEFSSVGGGTNWCPTCSLPNAGWSNVDFVNFSLGSVTPSDFALSGASAYKAPYAFGKNAGADTIQIVEMTAGAASGVPNPSLDFIIRTVFPSTTTMVFRFTAPTIAACTLTVSQNWDYSSPIYNTADSGGNRERAPVATGLTASRQYFWKIDCASGGYVRTGVGYTLP